MKLFPSFSNRTNVPEIRRVRHEFVRRNLEVCAVERLTPHMIRVTLEGAELVGFTSPSPDDHIKIFVSGLNGATVRRDYTPRHYDPRSVSSHWIKASGYWVKGQADASVRDVGLE